MSRLLSRRRRTAAPSLDLADIQGGILHGYRLVPKDQRDASVPDAVARYIFLRFPDTDGARTWLQGRVAEVNTEEWKERPVTTLNLSFTYLGLEALGVHAHHLGCFPGEFRAGMRSRADDLGDNGPGSPDCWDEDLREGERHALVTLHARDLDALATETDRLEATLGAPGAPEVVAQQLAEGLPPGGEHFGFRDGLSQPAVAGVHDQESLPGHGHLEKDGSWRPLAVGEFLLGHVDEDGWMAGDLLHEDLRRNGSYVVWRKLQQNVATFRETFEKRGKTYPGGPEALKAKVIGRWPDGTPVALRPNAPDGELAQDKKRNNDFRYKTKDGKEDDLTCPRGAHVLRTNPRDAFRFGPVMTMRHRIIRRGVTYGQPLPEGAPDDGERGLIFVCFQASIRRQFEVIQSDWCNNGNPFGLGGDKDYFLGDPGETAKMTIPGEPPWFLTPQPNLVVTKGGEYLFAPGIGALRGLADGRWARPTR